MALYSKKAVCYITAQGIVLLKERENVTRTVLNPGRRKFATFPDQKLLKVCFIIITRMLQKVRKQGIRFWDERTFSVA